MPNIKFNYLYRDAANYKNFGSVIFSNSQNLTLDELNAIIKSKLVDEAWFYTSEWNLASLFFSNLNPEIDPTWHEFESMEYTDEAPNATITLTEFINHPVISTAGRDLL